MKTTIEDVESQAAQELGPALRSFLKDRYPILQNLRASVSLFDGSGRKKRRSASADNWSPESDEIRIRFEPGAEESQVAKAENPAIVAASAAAPQTLEAVGISKLIQALDRAEKRPGYPFVSLKWFRDQALPEEGPLWKSSEEYRQTILRTAIERRLILTSKVPNPRSPQFPVTAIRLNRLMSDVQKILGGEKSADSDFHPIEIKGEPLSATIIRERHR